MTDGSRAIIAAFVDDDERMLWSLENLLESADYTVRLFASAETLLEGAHLAEVDCLISDIDLPKINGFELVRRAHAARPELPIILITGHHALGERPPPSGSGHYRLFRKPFDGQEFLEAVSEAVRRPQGRS